MTDICVIAFLEENINWETDGKYSPVFSFVALSNIEAKTLEQTMEDFLIHYKYGLITIDRYIICGKIGKKTHSFQLYFNKYLPDDFQQQFKEFISLEN